MKIGVRLDDEMLAVLERLAEAERRPLAWEAEVLLRRALGLPFPAGRQPAEQEQPAEEAGNA